MAEKEQDGLPLEEQAAEKQAAGDPPKKTTRGRAKKEEEPAPEVTQEDVAAAQEQVTNWEFIDRIPSPEQVLALLAQLPTWWGVEPKDFADYVQALPSDKRIKVPERGAGGGVRKVERWFSVVTLYFSVAGRMQMCRTAQELNGWRVDFVPEPVTPSGTPGFIDLGVESGRIVYREYVEIWRPLAVDETFEADNALPVRWIDGQKFELLGRRPGMAWVPYTGGQQAKGSNPFEKVETAARGRALAAWGWGVLPGSGVASYEEMLGVPANRQGIAGETGDAPAGNGGKQRETPKELIGQLLAMAEEIRQLRGEPDGWNLSMLRQYAKDVQNVDIVTAMDRDDLPAEIDLMKVNAGSLVIMRNGLRRRLTQAKDDQESGS